MNVTSHSLLFEKKNHLVSKNFDLFRLLYLFKTAEHFLKREECESTLSLTENGYRISVQMKELYSYDAIRFPHSACNITIFYKKRTNIYYYNRESQSKTQIF